MLASLPATRWSVVNKGPIGVETLNNSSGPNMLSIFDWAFANSAFASIGTNTLLVPEFSLLIKSNCVSKAPARSPITAPSAAAFSLVPKIRAMFASALFLWPRFLTLFITAVPEPKPPPTPRPPIRPANKAFTLSTFACAFV